MSELRRAVIIGSDRQTAHIWKMSAHKGLWHSFCGRHYADIDLDFRDQFGKRRCKICEMVDSVGGEP
jgi:hypothetical protein